MVRWQPGSRDRLQAAALELYLSQGFEQTTVTEIAASVGLTERTFFRHFADKREVLFDGQEQLKSALLTGLTTAGPGVSALDLVTAALTGSAGFFPDERREYSRRRQLVIEANPGLQERELLKLAGLARVLAGAVRERGVADPTATIAAESALTIFGVAFGQWIALGETRSFADLQLDGLDALRVLTH